MKPISPEMSLAALLAHFVNLENPPGIDKNGRPVYGLMDKSSQGSGCAVYVLAKVRPDFIAKLDAIGTHEGCRACNLPAAGVPIEELVEWKQGYGKSHSISFFEDIQQAHDAAATAHHYRVTRTVTPTNTDVSLREFRRDFTNRIHLVANNYGVNWSEVESLANKANMTLSDAIVHPAASPRDPSQSGMFKSQTGSFRAISDKAKA